jgi:hypothetical protein
MTTASTVYVKIEKALLEQVLNYMATKPFNEVSGLIQKVAAEAKVLTEESAE